MHCHQVRCDITKDTSESDLVDYRTTGPLKCLFFLSSTICSYYFAMSTFIYSTVWRNTSLDILLTSPVRFSPSHGFNCLKIHTTDQIQQEIGYDWESITHWSAGSQQIWQKGVNVQSIPTTWKVLFSKITNNLLNNKIRIKELPFWTHTGIVGRVWFARRSCRKKSKKLFFFHTFWI